MKAILFTISLAVSAMFLCSCSSKELKCDASDAKDLVIQIVKEQRIIGTSGFPENELRNVKISNIRTQEVDKQTGKHACKADITYDEEWKASVGPPIGTVRTGITREVDYLTEMTSDKKPYVSVFR